MKITLNKTGLGPYQGKAARPVALKFAGQIINLYLQPVLDEIIGTVFVRRASENFSLVQVLLVLT